MSEDALQPVNNRAMTRNPRQPDDGKGFWRTLDWIKLTKELGFPIVVGGFLLWKMSAFVDVGITAQQTTAESVGRIATELTGIKDGEHEKAAAILELKKSAEFSNKTTHQLQRDMIGKLDINDKKVDILIELHKSTEKVLRKGLNVKNSDMDDPNQ